MWDIIFQIKQLENLLQRAKKEVENQEVTNSELKEEVETLEVINHKWKIFCTYRCEKKKLKNEKNAAFVLFKDSF